MVEPAKIAQEFKRTDLIFSHFDTTVSPGCALSVMKDGRIIYQRGYGMADLDHNVPITPDTVFHVASMSKQFTATSVLLLVRAGKLSLDDDIHKYLPELPDFGQKITVADLMHHTSGIRDQWGLLDLAGWRYSADLITDQDIMYLIDRQKKLNFSPGTRMLYSNTGYTLLGQIVQRLSGQSLRSFTQKNIFEPLSMNRTQFRDSHSEVVKQIAYGYKPTKQQDVFEISLTNFDTVGATGLLTTVKDLAGWDENFYTHRVGGQWLFDSQVKAATLNNGDYAYYGDLIYASGLMLGKYRGLPIVEHTGGDAGYRSDLIRFPNQHFSVACLCNRADAAAAQLARRVSDIFLAQNFKEPPPGFTMGSAIFTISPDQLKLYTGVYWTKATRTFINIEISGGLLQLLNGDGSILKLYPLSDTEFEAESSSARYVFDKDGDTGKYTLAIRRSATQPAESYERVEFFHPSSAQLKQYEGVYVSDEVDTQIKFIQNDNALVLERSKREPEKFIPMMADVFQDPSKGVNVHFQRNEKGEVVSLLLNDERRVNQPSLLDFCFQKMDRPTQIPRLGANCF